MNELHLLLIAILLLCAAVTAATLLGPLRSARILTALGTLVLGGAITIGSHSAPGVVGGLLVAAAGSVLMLRANTERRTHVLTEAPLLAFGPPMLVAYIFVDYATAMQAQWSPLLTGSVLWCGLAMLTVATVGAVTAARLPTALRWQTLAQWALLPVVFGTGQPAAGPIAAGLLAHTIATTTALGLALGLLAHAAAGDDRIATLRLTQPLGRAGTAYALAAASSAGVPPLLGYALRRVVVLLAAPLPWLAPLLIALSSLLTLSYMPALLLFWRSTRHSPLAARHAPGTWPLALMLALLAAGAVPDIVWQWLLGDPSVTGPHPPPIGALVQTAITGVIVVLVALLARRALRRRMSAAQHAEDAWALPFGALRAVLRPTGKRRSR
jgi:multicomponent Na+:H+ antiporter subunit A